MAASALPIPMLTAQYGRRTQPRHSEGTIDTSERSNDNGFWMDDHSKSYTVLPVPALTNITKLRRRARDRASRSALYRRCTSVLCA
ncbi:unnamed protein product [Peniophora sp. CBMAI 1063]|nr:unnamed protein product [Peniophora sp. CBMAI 1063]